MRTLQGLPTGDVELNACTCCCSGRVGSNLFMEIVPWHNIVRLEALVGIA